MRVLDWQKYQRVVVLTGAGISAASGLRTYRGPGGLWADPELAKLSRAEQLSRDPASVWGLFGPMRTIAAGAEPNAGHRALALAQKRMGTDGRFSVITQNVDGLHQRAGTLGVIELHGTLSRTRCMRAECTLVAFQDSEEHTGSVPVCGVCGSALRPDVVMFDEAIPVDAEWASKKALRGCDLFIAVGTSGTVTPAANFVRSAEYEGAHTVLVNLTPNEPRNPAFREEILGRAEEVLPVFLGVEV